MHLPNQEIQIQRPALEPEPVKMIKIYYMLKGEILNNENADNQQRRFD